MLGKLLKYDLKANWIYFLIMYGIVIGYSVLFALFLRMSGNDIRVQLTMVTVVAAYVFLLMAVSIMTTVLIVVRFYKNMFGAEGYLTHTLPVSPAMHLSSKVLSAVIWNVLTFGVCALSVCLVTMGQMEDIKSVLWWVLEQIYEQYDGRMFVLYGISAVLSMITGIFVLYLVMCLGQLANRHRVLCSIGFYVAYLVINQVIQLVFNVVIGVPLYDKEIKYVDFLFCQGAEIFISLAFLVLSALLSHYLIARKLNLE